MRHANCRAPHWNSSRSAVMASHFPSPICPVLLSYLPPRWSWRPSPANFLHASLHSPAWKYKMHLLEGICGLKNGECSCRDNVNRARMSGLVLPAFIQLCEVEYGLFYSRSKETEKKLRTCPRQSKKIMTLKLDPQRSSSIVKPWPDRDLPTLLLQESESLDPYCGERNSLSYNVLTTCYYLTWIWRPHLLFPSGQQNLR